MSRPTLLFLALAALSACSSGGGPNAVVEGPAVGTVRVRLVNETMDLLYAIRNQTNDSLEPFDVEGLRAAASINVRDRCGADGTHDDPFHVVEAVFPSSSIDYVWGESTSGAAELVRDDARNCTRLVHVPEGSVTVHACLFTERPTTPETDSSALPKRCSHTTVVVPAAGEAVAIVRF